MQTEDFTSIHSVYISCTDRNLPLSVREHFLWAAWTAHEPKWTADDLRLVIAFINGRIKQGRRFPESLRLYNLIDPARFADDYLDAKAEARKPVRSDRQSVLEATGRPEQVPDHVQSAEQVIRGSEALRKLLELRDNL